MAGSSSASKTLVMPLMVGPIWQFAGRYTHRAPMSCPPLDLELRIYSASRQFLRPPAEVSGACLDGRHPMTPARERPILTPRDGEPADQLRAQVLWLDDVVDH